MKRDIFFPGIFLMASLMAGCGGGGGGGGNSDPTFPVTVCTPTVDDSIQNPDGTANRIRSESFGTYGSVTLTRQTDIGGSITQDYMIHEPSAGTIKGFLVLIAGGGMDAGITPPISGTAPDSANGNFLVRSAHLFANQGYRVLTIDRPDDYLTYNPSNISSSYDSYRISPEHAVDLSELINLENTGNLPVIIAGTSRGSISAVAQHELGAVIAISGPLTGGIGGSPITISDAAQVTEPTHVLWHDKDGCSVTTPAAAASLVGVFPDASGQALDGGFSASNQPNPCRANTFHGFLGIETCAVTHTTDWISNELDSIAPSRPTANPVSDNTFTNNQKDIDLSGSVIPALPGLLTYELPHTTTSLGGTVSISGTTVTYNPPAGITNTTDTFVYVVSESGGGTSHNVVSVTINP